MRSQRFGIKVAQMGGSYAEIRDAWLEADRLGFDTGWLHGVPQAIKDRPASLVRCASR